MSIKAIIWDLGGVLVRTEDADVYVTAAKKTQLPYEKIREVYFSEMNDKQDLGEVNKEQFNTYVMDTLGISKEQFAHLEEIIEEGPQLDEEMMGWITEQHKKCKIGLLSNWTADVREKIEEEWQIGHVFDEIVISSEVGLLKPGSEIFTLMLDRLGVSADEAVFVDDRIKNIEGAKKVGLQTVYYKDREQTIEELERMLGEE